MKKTVLTALAVASLAGTAMARPTTIEFRVVGTGQGGDAAAGSSSISIPQNTHAGSGTEAVQGPGTDGAYVLNLALQARVTGSTTHAFLSDFGGTLRATGELDTYGFTNQAKSNNNATSSLYATQYTGAADIDSGNGTFGLANPYKTLGGQGLNGTINPSNGTSVPVNNPNDPTAWANDPPSAEGGTTSQEIYKFAGRLQGTNLLQSPGASATSGTGITQATKPTAFAFSTLPSGGSPADAYSPHNAASSATVTGVPALTTATNQWGADGTWINVFVFQYVLIDTSVARDTTWAFQTDGTQAGYADILTRTNGTWGVISTLLSTTGATYPGFDIHITAVPAPGSAALLGLGGLVVARRRRQA